MKINELPIENRPREKAIKYGISSLNNQEILALIIGSGVTGVSAIDIANNLLSNYCYSLKNLSNINLESLLEFKGLSKNNALKLLATFEFHKRLNLPINSKVQVISNPNDVYNRYKYLEDYEQEVLALILLDSKFRIIKEKILYKGTFDSFSIRVNEILKELVIGQAKNFILVHNHPDESKTPSKHDLITTKCIEKNAANLSIRLVDHIIIYKNGFHSLKMNKQNND